MKKLKKALKFGTKVLRENKVCFVFFTQRPTDATTIRIGIPSVWIEIEVDCFLSSDNQEYFFNFLDFKKLARLCTRNRKFRLEARPDGVLFVTHDTLIFLKTQPSFDFLDVTKENEIHVPAVALVKALRSVQASISLNPLRIALQGVYLHTSDDNFNCLRLVATDGHRLAENAIQIQNEKLISTRVEKDVVDFISDLMPAEDEIARITLYERSIKIGIDGFQIFSNAIWSSFVPYKHLFPDTFIGSATIDKVAAISVAQESVARGNRKGPLGVVLDFEKSLVRLRPIPNYGYADSFVSEFPATSSLNVRIGVDPKYLVDVLNASDVGEVSIFFPPDVESGSYATKPLLITFAGDDRLRILLQTIRPHTFEGVPYGPSDHLGG